MNKRQDRRKRATNSVFLLAAVLFIELRVCLKDLPKVNGGTNLYGTEREGKNVVLADQQSLRFLKYLFIV